MQAETSQKTKNSTSVGVQLLNLNRVSSKPEGGHCGYCDGNGSYSWGFTKQVMHPYTYQLLAERGWRRCGTYYYKPEIKKSCCKLWTHRLDINGFKIKKDQKKTVRSVFEWLMRKMDAGFKKGSEKNQMIQKNQLPIKQQEKNPPEKSTKMQSQKSVKVENSKNKTKIVQQIPEKWLKISQEAAKLILKTIEHKKQQFFNLFLDKLISQDKCQQFQYKIDLNKVKCFISKPTQDCDWYANHLMLLFGTNKKLFHKQYNNVDFVKDVKDWIETNLNEYKIAHFQVERSGYLFFNQFNSEKLARKEARERERIENQNKHKEKMDKKEHNPYNPIKDPKEILREQLKQSNEKKQANQAMEEENLGFQLCISSTEISFGPLSIFIVPAEVTTQSWRMYQRYCEEIHEKPEKSQSSYSGFLCEKALQFISEQSTKNPQKKYTASWDKQNSKNSSQVQSKVTKLMGCYHMKYYIQKQLIGVGVVDFFPHGLSSVYFFYEPKYKDLRLGVFSSLVEIEYVRWLSLSFPEFKYYYMGFYIQNCQKMIYKGNYEPFDLLCPITYQFVECTQELRQLIDKIEKKQVESVQLAKNNNKIADMNFQQSEIGVYLSQKIKIKYNGMNLTLKQLNPKILIPVLGMLRQMVQVWGRQVFQIFTFTF